MSDRVGIDLPTIEVRFEKLELSAEAHVGGRALPTLLNSTINVLEVQFFFPGVDDGKIFRS